MEKTEFEYQRYRLRTFLAFPLLIPAFLFNAWLGGIIGNELLFYFMCVIVMVILLSVYYRVTDHFSWFLGKGTYRFEDHALVLEMGRKTIRIEDVNELMEDITGFYGTTCAMLVIRGSQKCMVYSGPVPYGTEFRDSSLEPLGEAILEHFPELEPVYMFKEKTDGWYKRKKPEK
ncbi:MAG: hypothetical protein K6A40_00120 [Solobacterium sp.]|nr:hypothetical protein [Solobacterium sp.]